LALAFNEVSFWTLDSIYYRVWVEYRALSPYFFINRSVAFLRPRFFQRLSHGLRKKERGKIEENDLNGAYFFGLIVSDRDRQRRSIASQ
jgi:hypothetical protein